MAARDVDAQNAEVASCAQWMTNHAKVRTRQRGIDLATLACLLKYGWHVHDHRGAQVVTYDANSLEEVARREPRAVWRNAVDARTLYAVVDADGHVMTAGHRYRRLPRDLSLSSCRPGRSRKPRILHAPARRLST